MTELPQALFFDVFGTVVDWRTSIARDIEAVNEKHGCTLNPTDFADRWRALYQPAMEPIRRRDRAYLPLDVLHRENLEQLLSGAGMPQLSRHEIGELNRAWHRLDPWPDSVPGLLRLKTRFIVASMSNGNFALIVNMAKRAGLPWDVILGAEAAHAYKPSPECYLTGARLIGRLPEQCMMVAAHNSDLAAARALGFQTAFVVRPLEYGPGQSSDLEPAEDWDMVVRSMEELADQLGCT